MLGGGLIGSSALTKTSAPTRCESQSPFRSVTSYALVHLVIGCGLGRLIPVRSDLRPVISLCTVQVWQIDMRNEADELTCVSCINTAAMAPKATSIYVVFGCMPFEISASNCIYDGERSN
jgi:hypothetical protein